MPAEPPDFADFRALSAALGQDPLCAQGAGGNISVKHQGVLWVKASGAWLKDAAAKNIFVAVEHANALAQLDRKAEPLWHRLDGDATLRPSIETSLHAALPHRIVVHIHSVPVIALAVRRDAAKQLDEKLAGLRFAFVPYTKPGWPLTQALHRISPMPDVIILGNHGLIVGGESVANVKSRLADIEARLRTAPRTAPPPDIRFLEQAAKKDWRLPRENTVHALATDAISRSYATGGTLYPDHVVFLGCGCRAVAGNELPSVDSAKQPMVLIEGKGILLASTLSPAGETMAECLAAVVSRIPAGAELNYLTSRDEDELLNWDAEKYRQGVM